MKVVFLVSAFICVLMVALISLFLFGSGLPFFAKYGVLDFLTGVKWAPLRNIFGILPMIVGSLYISLGAVLLAAPVGVMAACYVVYFASAPMQKVLRPAVKLMAGIPSVVFGFLGLMLLVPFIRDVFDISAGNTILAAAVLLAMMILPTVIQTAEAALLAVPVPYMEGAMALGATREYAVLHTMVPAGRSGIMSGIVLGLGRAVGETTAVIMVAGNQPRMPKGILKGVRTLTSNIIMEMGYAADLHRDSLIATGVVLFVLILLINTLFSLVKRKRVIQ